MKSRAFAFIFAIGLLLLVCAPASAHFQTLLPSRDIVDQPGAIAFDICFTHPMEQGPVMEMARPAQFGVLANGKKRDLLPSLQARKVDGKTAFTADFKIEEPADYVFYLAPAPYWEPAENKMIVHYTKVVVDAMGAGEGWDAMIGFPVEIRPLTRPYGVWTGNIFRGVVMKQDKAGKPVPVAFADVEVEYYNEGRKVAPPSEPFITQVIKTDAAGVFDYAMPRAGWWGFAALVEGDAPMKSPQGKDVSVEIGGLMWVKCADMK